MGYCAEWRVPPSKSLDRRGLGDLGPVRPPSTFPGRTRHAEQPCAGAWRCV